MPVIKEEIEKESRSNKIIDIRGKICPLTFVYTKLALEKMEKGDILEVILDFPPALKNIPNSCMRQDLAELIEIKKLNSDDKTWKLILKKL
ncbi:MAG: sulfurtransferase TusA family protein [Promethearchaeota archaeon]